jgi:hypothetical protein
MQHTRCLYWQLYLQTPITTELLTPLPQVFASHVLSCQNPDCGEPNVYNARQFSNLAGITMMLTIKAEGALVGTRGSRTTTVFQVLQRNTARLQEVERKVTHKQQVAKRCCSLCFIVSHTHRAVAQPVASQFARDAEARRTSFAADCNTTVALAFGYSNRDDDAKIAALLQSGACTTKAALATKLDVGPNNKTLRIALKRVLDTKSAGTIKEYIAAGADKKQKRR